MIGYGYKQKKLLSELIINIDKHYLINTLAHFWLSKKIKAKVKKIIRGSHILNIEPQTYDLI